MPGLSTIRKANMSLANKGPCVVVLAGGTTGIGSYIALALARTFASKGGKLRVYIVGRNEARAVSVIDTARRICPGSDWLFVKVSDLAYISEVDAACDKILGLEHTNPLHEGASIDLLYMTHGWPVLKKSPETSEGLDSFLSMMYYSRIRFIFRLMDLLVAGPRPGRAVSVYAGGFEDGAKLGDLPVGLPPPSEYGVASVRKHACFMKTFMFEKLATLHKDRLSLIHIYPGLVDGPGMTSPDMPLWFRTIYRAMKPLLSLGVMVRPDDCGQVMVYLAGDHYSPQNSGHSSHNEHADRSTDGNLSGGSYALGRHGDVNHKRMLYEKVRNQEIREEVWRHTTELLSQIKPR